MTDTLLQFFVTLLVVVDPVGVVPLFTAVTEGATQAERRHMARKGVAIALAIFLLFAFGGGQLLRLLGVSLDAFRIFGGLLLFLIALEMVFARPSGARSSGPEMEESRRKRDVSVFPLAFPLLAGPGSLTAIMLAFGPAAGDLLLQTGLLACIAATLALTLAALYLGTSIQRLLGVTASNVLQRLLGVLLGALAVQYVLDGVRGSLLS